MRATRLLMLGLAALAVTGTVGCAVNCDIAQQAPARARTRPKDGAKKRQLLAVHAGAVKAVVDLIPRGGIPEAAAWKAAASWDVKGWGRTQAEAEQDALVKARKKVIEHLRLQEEPLRWTPSTSYIRTHLVSGAAKHLEKEDQFVKEIDLRTECWSLPVTITPLQYQEMMRQDRAYRARLRKEERDARAEERLLLAGKVMAGLLLLIVAVGGYIRLDELTGGAYTRWLQLGLGSVLTVGVGLLLLN